MPEIRRVQYPPNAAPKPDNRELSDWELSLAHCIVGDFLICRGPISGIEHEDLVQEVLVHWLKQRLLFDESRGASIRTFFRTVARNRLEDLHREMKAARRGGNTAPVSLDKNVGDTDTVLGDLIPDSEDMTERVEGNAVHDYILESFTPRQRTLVEGLEQGYRLSEMARKMNVPRTTLNDELARIKRTLRKMYLA